MSLFQLLWLVFGLLVVCFFTHYRLKISALVDIFVGILIFAVGISLVKANDHREYDLHYTNLVSLEEVENDTIVLRITEVQKPTFSARYTAEVEQINSDVSFGKVIIYAPSNSSLDVDDRLLNINDFKAIAPPKNPFQFDYRNFLQRRHIYASITVKDSSYLTLTPAKTVKGLANKARNRVLDWMKPWQLNDKTLSIFEALILGQRQNMSEEIRESFEQAGVVHVLAISGLHIGIILLFLKWLFRPLKRLPFGRALSLTFIVLILWCFAIVSGLSPSVTRAVGMFTLLALSMSINRRTKLINTVMAAAFLSLLVDPLMLYDIGFQLSYAAVISIVLFTSFFQKFWKTKHPIFLWARDSLAVTLSAQIGVLPISLFYFHQFPGLFLIANFVLLPLVFVVLLYSFLLIALGSFGLYNFVLGQLYQSLIALMTKWVTSIAGLDQFFFDGISFGWFELLSSYFIIFIIVRFFMRPRAQRVQHVLLAFIVVLSVSVYIKYQPINSELVIFHKAQHTLIGMKYGNSVEFYHDLENESKESDQTILDYQLGVQIKSAYFKPKSKLFEFNKQLWLVLDSTGIQKSPSFPIHGLILTQSPRFNLERWLDRLRPNIVVADGSNYTSYMNRWEQTCQRKSITYYRTDREGAYILSLND